MATANDIESLPPELVRKGRLDEIFFVDLPDAETRKIIFSIHIEKRKQDLSFINLDQLVQHSEGFSGSEIEQSVVSALYTAHAQKNKLSDEIIIKELSRTRPLSVVMAERINNLRVWARDRTVLAN